jgi:cytochrome P450
MCIGVTLAWVEMRTALAKTVLAFDWELADGNGDWVEEARLKQLWKKPPLMMHFRPVKRK